jgi:hypothetical protein
MKRFLILFLALFLLTVLSIACEGPIISVKIIIPMKLIPYYDWLLEFPGWHFDPQESPPPTDPVPGKFQVNNSGDSAINQAIRNIHYNQITGDIK